ncbi:MAG: hypothetical protein ACYSX1_10785, partial [Planctomycetota bacterium]
MCRRLVSFVCFVLVMGVAGTVRADIIIPPPPTYTVTAEETHVTIEVGTGGTLEVTSTGVLNVTGESSVDGGLLLINDGNVVVDARFNLGTGNGGTVTLNGGSFTITRDWKMMDSAGGLSVCEVLGGTLTADNLQFSLPGERDGLIVIGGGTMIVEGGLNPGNGERDPQEWLDNGWLIPAPGYPEVTITYEPAGGYTLTAGAGPKALYPIPGYEANDVCPEGLVLGWTPYEGVGDVNGHDVYFGTDFASVENAQVGDDPNNVYKGRQDSNTYPEVGSLNLEFGQWYYWRIDEVNEPNSDVWPGFVWKFRTQDSKARNPFPGDGWKGLPSDVDLSWAPPCTAVDHNLYFGTSWDDVNDGTGGTDKGSQSPGYDPGALSTFTWYYWRVDEVNGVNTVTGDVWSFKTGLAGVLMHYKFDGGQGADLPSPITDNSGNNIQFTKYVDGGSVTYGEPNPMYNVSGTSADFDPCAGLYRLDTGEDDLLRLDNYQYTIEMWLYINAGDYVQEDMMLVGKEAQDFSWSFEISDLGDDNQLRWVHNGTRINGNVLEDRYDEWMHVAAVFDITDPETSQRLYVNKEVVETGNNRGLNPVDANAVGIGCERDTGANFAKFMDGRIDELRIVGAALDVLEFLYPRAIDPSPYDGEGNVDPNDPNEPDDPNVTLSWTPWAYADQHDLYFGTDYDSVRLATIEDEVYVGRLDSNSYDVNGLDYATNYYWRIDEVEGSDVHPGGLPWRFLTEYIVVDPNLLLWYTYDEGAGNWVYDNSGHGLNGYNAYDYDINDSWRSDGAFGGCLEFDDNIGFDLETRTLEGVSNAITIAVWLDGYRPGAANWVIHAGGYSTYDYIEVIVPDGNDDYVYWQAGNDTNDLLIWKDITPEDWEGDWHHFAFVKDENAGTM